MAKIQFKTKKFNKNQKIWVIQHSGNNASFCIGKYRGTGRYIKYWVNWCALLKPAPDFIKILVSKEFSSRHGLNIFETVK